MSRVRLPDGVLRLHAEQEGRAEVRHVVHAGHVLGAGGGPQVPCRGDIYCLQSRYVLVTVLPGYQVPDYAEYEPRGEVGTWI